MTQKHQKNFSPIVRTRRRVQLSFEDSPSLTQQQFKDDCDIHKILDLYSRTGQLPFNQKQGAYLDISQMPNYLEAQNFIIKAKNQFAELPGKVRERFKNDPHEFLKFMGDKENLPEMVKLGLATQTQEPASSPAPASKPTGKPPQAPVPPAGEGSQD